MYSYVNDLCRDDADEGNTESARRDQRQGSGPQLSRRRQALIYTRGQDTERQLFECKRYAHGIRVPVNGIFSDARASGFDLNRPSFKAMLAAIDEGSVTDIIVADLARVSRDLTSSLRFLEVLAERGLLLHEAGVGQSVEPIHVATSLYCLIDAKDLGLRAASFATFVLPLLRQPPASDAMGGAS